MAIRTSNVIVGAAQVFLSRVDSLGATWPEALPARVDGTPYGDTLNAGNVYKEVGLTSTGVEFAYTPSYGEVEVDQLLDAAKMFKEKMTASVKTSFAEATLENLIIVWAQGASSLRKVGATATTDIAGRTVDPTKDFEGATVPAGEEVVGVEAGALGIEPVERQLVFIGGSQRTTVGNKKRERIYQLRRALSVEATTHSLKKSEATMFPVSFRVLPAEVSGAEYGTIRDRVITS